MGLFRRIFGNSGTLEADADAQLAVEPQHITGAEFTALIQTSELPLVVDFWADWCAPCRAIAPSVAALANEFNGRALVAKLNADDYPEILAQYGIMGIPTLIYFKDGQEVDRVVGMTAFGTLKSKLERLLA